MSIILFLLFGLFVGLIARAVMPGEQKMGVVMTTGLGMAGSFLGGMLASLVTDSRVTDLNTAGLVGSILGAVLLLLLAGGVLQRRHHV